MTKTKRGNAQLAQQIADDLVDQMDEFHSLPEVWDNALDTQIAKWYANAPNVFPKRPYFSPSSANACPKELYYKAKRAPKDVMRKQPHQSRWQKIGTSIGDMIQREILSMERNYEKHVGQPCRFKFERTDKGEPLFEEFAKRNVLVEHNGKSFYLYGTGDGVMQYVADDGEVFRVGLEVKSKQTTAARTSLFSMRKPEESHVKQCVSYAHMYNLDMFVILYVNASKKTWVYAEGDYEKNPDIRAFGVHVTDEDKTELFDRFTEILDSIDEGKPLPLKVDGWLFNPYKTLIAKEMPEEEFGDLKRMNKQMSRSSLPEFKKRNFAEVVDFISEVREAE
ncbi:hypothetical protein JOC34_002860 [Virgibacillus halotolerans]|uniref:hypothetical protein n=1 Tax=Virgibacillus halotolerans TaxID=1071053 RepID=UPI001EF77726|nr:hypothetical protein [Virgibacillus halotolerans]MBM7600469.1 hypothetical protein [Virgibacillus halotolerans]